MGSKKSQFLGHVFEGAFKLGFLKGKIGDYDDFKKNGVFNYILQKYEEYQELEDLILVWKNLEQKVSDSLESLKELELKYTEENLLYFIFLVGFYEGLFFGKEIKNPELIKYEIGEESSEAGRYENADLIFINNKALYVIDLKLGGAQHRAKYILDGAEELYIPFRTPGVPVNLSLGEIGLGGFLKNLLNLGDKLLSLQNVYPEIKGFIQTLSYAVDYLCENEGTKSISEVSISLFYPLAEPFSARFYWNGEKLNHYRELIKGIYEEIKNKEWEYAEVENGTAVRNERLLEKTSKKIEELEGKIRKIEAEPYVIKVDSIDSARKDVKERLEDFLKREDSVKVLCLLHSAGSGKTTQTREAILKMEGKHIVLYTATRKVLLKREDQVLSKLCETHEDIKVVYKERNTRSSKLVENVGDVYREVGVSAGILKQTVEEIKKLAGKNRIIWALCTQQAVIENEKGNSTSKHLSDLATDRIIDNYYLHIILDEFLGHSNGLFVINEMFEFLNWVKEKGGRANLYLFDANGYSPSILKKLLEEYTEFKVIPDAIMVCDHKKTDEFEHNSIKIFVHAKHGYPSPQIILRKKFIQENNIQKMISYITTYIKSTIQKNNTAFVYLQHKKMLSELRLALEKEGFSTLVATADSRKSQERINKGDEDIILSTSALSRGIDLSRPKKPVNQIYIVIHNWGIENNLVELIQTISRARGDEETEKNPKEIHLIYSLPVSDWTVDAILEYLDKEVDKDTIKLLLQKQVLEQLLELDYVVSQIIEQFVKNPEEGKKALVPVPKQYRTKYIPNPIGDFEGLISFVSNIYELTREEKLYKLYDNLLKSLHVSAVKIDFENAYSYYHPYILFERQEVRVVFDDRLRGRIYHLFNSVENLLKEHNPEKAELLRGFISNFLSATSKKMPVLIPVYSYVLTKHILKKGERVKFHINKSVGRGGADSMMGDVKPCTYCINGENLEEEYACIPLGEEYPYKEVLSGRFAKFPIEFLRRLLDERV